MCDSTLAIYCFIDDFLKASGHREDIRVEVTDAEVMTIAITAMFRFGGRLRALAADFARTRINQKISFAFQIFAPYESLGGFNSKAFSSIGECLKRPALGVALYP
jgi:hypothetical protein